MRSNTVYDIGGINLVRNTCYNVCVCVRVRTYVYEYARALVRAHASELNYINGSDG